MLPRRQNEFQRRLHHFRTDPIVMMLEHISEKKAAARISAALHTVLIRGERLTPDLGGSATTSQFAEAILREIEK